MKLTVENVDYLVSQCLFSKEDIPEGGMPPKELWADGGGIVRHVVFDKRKIEEHKDDIKSLLSQLSEDFFDQKNGSSFINMPFDKNGKQWGEQRNAEALMSLGKAAGFVWHTPRMLWFLSFGVPMIIIDLNGLSEKFKKLDEMEKKELEATEELKVN